MIPRRLTYVLLAIILLSTFPVRSIAAQGEFVTRSGSDLLYRGAPYRFTGVNLRGLAHEPSDAVILEQLQAASDMSARVVRIFIANNDASTATVIERLRHLLDLADQVDPELKFIVALTDFYNNSGLWVSGDAPWYSREAGGYTVLSHDWFRTGFRQNYQPFAVTLAGEFGASPQIFAWELGNEIQAASADDMLAFVYEMGEALRRAGAQQLISTGFISSHHAAGGDYSGRELVVVVDDFYNEWNGRPSPIDVLSFHGYNNDWAPGRPNTVDPDIRWSGSHIPAYMGEIGFSGAFSGPGSCPAFAGEEWDGIWLPEASASRGPAVRAAVDHFVDLGTDGVLQWGFVAGSDTGQGDDCVGMDDGLFHADWDDLFSYYREKALSLIGEPLPPTATPPTPETPTQPTPETPTLPTPEPTTPEPPTDTPTPQSNQPPVAGWQPSVRVTQGQSVQIELIGSDPDGDPITFRIVTGPRHGLLDDGGDGDAFVSYTADTHFQGGDSFTYVVSDGELDSPEGAVGLNVIPTPLVGSWMVFDYWVDIPSTNHFEGYPSHVTDGDLDTSFDAVLDRVTGERRGQRFHVALRPVEGHDHPEQVSQITITLHIGGSPVREAELYLDSLYGNLATWTAPPQGFADGDVLTWNAPREVSLDRLDVEIDYFAYHDVGGVNNPIGFAEIAISGQPLPPTATPTPPPFDLRVSPEVLTLNTDGWYAQNPILAETTLSCPEDHPGPCRGELTLDIGNPDDTGPNDARFYLARADLLPDEGFTCEDQLSELLCTEDGGIRVVHVQANGASPVGLDRFRSYRFRTAPLEIAAGSSATYAWTIWVQPQEANSLSFAARWDDLISDQEFSDSASASVPTAQIHPLVFLPGLGATQPPTYNQRLADLVLMLGNRIAHYSEFYDALEKMGYERGTTYFLFPYDWLRSNIEAARHLRDDRLGPAAEAASSVPWVAGFGDPAAVDFDLVGHSNGTLVARAYIQGPSWNENVHRFVSIGGPHLGVRRGYTAYEGIAPEDPALDGSAYYLWVPPRAFLAGYGHLSCVPLLGCRWVLTMEDRYQFAHDPIAGLTILPEFLPTYGDYLVNENGVPAEPSGPFPFGRMANPLLEGQEAVDHQQVMDPWTDNPHLTSIPAGFETSYYGLNTPAGMQALDERLAGAAENVCLIFGGGVNVDTTIALDVAAPETRAPYWFNGRMESLQFDEGDTVIPALSANPSGIWPGQAPRSIDLDPLLAAQGEREADHARMVGYDLSIVETMRCLTGIEVPRGLLSGYSSGAATFGPESLRAEDAASDEPSRILVISALSQVELTLIDPQGRQLGFNSAGLDLAEIPSGLYIRDDQGGQNHLIVYEPSAADYTLIVTGTEADHGGYTVIGTLQDGEQVLNLFVAEDTVRPGEVNEHSTSVPGDPGTHPTPPEVEAGPDLDASVGESIVFSGAVSDANHDDAHTITWDFGDGGAVTGSLSPTHSYTQAGVYLVTLTAVDSSGFSENDALQVTIRALSGPPLAQDDAFSLDEDTPFSIESPGLLANDRDPDGDELTAVLLGPPANGTLTVQADGAFEYSPGPDFNGSDAFTYQALGGDQPSNAATVGLAIRPVNDPPVVNTGPDASISAGVFFTGQGSFSDPDQGDSWSGTVDFGDGSEPQELAFGNDRTFALSHPYPNTGSYVVTVTVRDTAGSTGVDALTVRVAPAEPSGPPMTIGDYVILAEDFVRVGCGSRVESGAVGANSGPDGAGSDEVILEGFARLSDDAALAADSLRLRAYSRASGDAYYNDLHLGRQAVIGGGQHSPLGLPLVEMPPLPDFEIDPSARNVNVLRSGRLGPGDYRAVTVWPFSTLRLTGGIYEFQRLRLLHEAGVICLAECEIRVVDVVRMHQGAELSPGRGLEASDVRVLIAAEEGTALEAYGSNRLEANVLAPWGRLRLGSGGRFEGAFLARQVVVGAYARVELESGFGQ